ncbi:transglutaminase domain-containing protein [[Eubacterium] cellulosolvens]
MLHLIRNIKHLIGDLEKIHDYLEHLNEHSGVCSELVKEANIRETSELFEHLGQIDKLIHEAQTHILHIKIHLEEGARLEESSYQEPIDIEDLKKDATHTTFDLKDIHIHIEHLISHANMCQDIIKPRAEAEISKIREHLMEIDKKAHELLGHITEIRGNISTKYPEFVWPVPDELDEFLEPTQLVDCLDTRIKDTALRLVDTTESIQMALMNILCFAKDFIGPTTSKTTIEVKATNTLESRIGGGIAKAILACALARAVSIPARIHGYKVPKDEWQNKRILNDIEEPKNDFSLCSPEFYINDAWEAAYDILRDCPDATQIYARFIDLGIPEPKIKLEPNLWKVLPLSYLHDFGVFAEPIKFLKDTKFSPPTPELEQRLFAGWVYLGPL